MGHPHITKARTTLVELISTSWPKLSNCWRGTGTFRPVLSICLPVGSPDVVVVLLVTIYDEYLAKLVKRET